MNPIWENTTTLLLAGGMGQRLYPLTRDRAKPAVPFGGIYRIIDFTLSNCLHSGVPRIYVLTQYKSFSLDHHLVNGWHPIFNQPELGRHMSLLPPQQRTGEGWYLGTANAINQNIYTLQQERPQNVLILSGDHVYKMNYQEMLQYHLDKNAELTVACMPIPKEEASEFGIAVTNSDSRITGFQEKPKENPAVLPNNPDLCLASMGIYIFNTESLVRRVTRDAKRDSAHDFGKNIIPDMVNSGADVFAWEFREPGGSSNSYWRDVGTLDAYYEANMDLARPVPLLDLYDENWPIRTVRDPLPPAKFVDADNEQSGSIADSLLSSGVVISGATVKRSVLSPSVRVHKGAIVEDSVIMTKSDIGEGAIVRNAVVDKRVKIPAGIKIGCDSEEDKKRFPVTAQGVIIISKEHQFV